MNRVSHAKSETHLNSQLQHQLSSYTLTPPPGILQSQYQIQIEAVRSSCQKGLRYSVSDLELYHERGHFDPHHENGNFDPENERGYFCPLSLFLQVSG